MNKYNLKVMSDMEKCFIDDDLSVHPETNNFIMFKNQRLSFQIALKNEVDAVTYGVSRLKIGVTGELSDCVKLRKVDSVANYFPCWGDGANGVFPENSSKKEKDFVRRYTPGLYPDPIMPLQYDGKLTMLHTQTSVLWVDVELPEDFAAGEYLLNFRFTDEKDEFSAETSVNIKVINANLPPQKLIHTEWFYCDCIAEAYHTEVWSDKHWELIEANIICAVKNGINMILTPIFTPELDTYVGGERLTTQLVKITVFDDGKYGFDFTLLNKWIEMCKRCGVKYFEFPHFYTQWGLKAAPKFVAFVKGEEKRIFGWETDALGKEYCEFLSQFIPRLVDCIKANGIEKCSYFHVSDEPHEDSLDRYKKCREFLSQYLCDFPIIDALSNIEYYKSGAILNPVPDIHRIEDFMKENIEGLWTYYCGTSYRISNRTLASYGFATRIIGVQLYLAKIKGFLHWGYNYYHNQYSYDYVNPFFETSGSGFSVSGDAFLVYPEQSGPAESLRLNAMRNAVDDIRALEMLEGIKGREYTCKLIEEVAGMKITFFDFPRNDEFLLRLRDRVAKEIEKEI